MIPPGYLLETKLGFRCPSTGCVLAEKGTKNVNSIDEGSPKENVAVIFSFSGNGKNVVQCLCIPIKELQRRLLRQFPLNGELLEVTEGE